MVVVMVSLDDIRQAFDALVSGQKPREDVARWAEQLIEAQELGLLEYSPSKEKPRIWDAIQYLSGVAEEDAPGSYFFSTDAFVEYRRELGV